MHYLYKICKISNYIYSAKSYRTKKAGLTPNEVSYNTLMDKCNTWQQQKPYYQEFIQRFPLRKGNAKSEKNYNFLFTALFKRIKSKEEWDFVQSEIHRLGLKMDTYAQDFYDSLKRKWQ